MESGATLKGSPNLNDYNTFSQPVYGRTYYGMLYTIKAQNVSITGRGTIDGNNPAFHNFSQAKKMDITATQFTRQKENYRKVKSGIGDGPVVPSKDRPHQIIIFSGCTNVQVENVSLLNSPF